jgi:sigma-B regulation protein RsbU (phosphoserine phosphatase)
MQDLEEELQMAHHMQMQLMPTEKPLLEGLDFAGRCEPANHVGGDYYQYFHYNNRLALTLADVTGHAMEAAIPVVMFSGILESQMDHIGSVKDLLKNLNRILHRSLNYRTFVCFAMAEIDLETRTLHISNGACPYPYHFSAQTGTLNEIEIDAYPLGIRNDTEYEEIEVQLAPGDYLIFCSDGIAEACNEQGDQFGYTKAQDVIRLSCEQSYSSEETIDFIFTAANNFRGEAPQGDDMTCMVLRIENP